MAAKRIAASAINWKAIAERVPENQLAHYFAFKHRSESYLKKVLANPVHAPEIDWASYQRTVPITGMVDNFKKSYAALEIPYPPDTVSFLIDDQEKQIKLEIADFKKQSEEKIQTYRANLAYVNSLLPFDQMTMEDFNDSYPGMAFDPLKKPTFWPHDAEEQIDYKDKGHPLYGTDPHQH